MGAMPTPPLTLKTEYSEKGHQGATEVRQSWELELSADRKAVVMVERYSKTHEPTDRTVKRSEKRLALPIEELISYFEQEGKPVT